ncbi:MAG TPA: DUF2703 domain-containing protein [Syntrophorhabdaceae bacterium]|nr:DUF2703 domain-containing protein [Syntrophorhabdaceae bacterium]
MQKKNQKIIIEFYRYEKEGATCCRCRDSTDIVIKIVREFKHKNPEIEIDLKEILLDEDGIDISNKIKIDGKDIRDVVGEKGKILTDCPSCSGLIGRDTICNSYIYKGKIFDSIPEEMLREAIEKVISQKK